MLPLSCREPDRNLRIGRIVEVDGIHVKAELDPSIDELSKVYNTEVYPIGQFGSIVKCYFGSRLLFMFVTRLRLKSQLEAERGVYVPPQEDSRVLEADLFGEGEWRILSTSPLEQKCQLIFQRGVSTYPLPLQDVYLTTSFELSSIYDSDNTKAITIGTYVGSRSVPCHAALDELLGKHTAVLGSTGSGKSSAVAAIVRAIMEFPVERKENWHPYIVILDPHNEYSHAFGEGQRLSSDERSLRLPYWLLNLHELTELFMERTAAQAPAQARILRDAIIKARREGALKTVASPDSITADSPVPFSLEALVNAITDSMPPQASQQDKHRSILERIEALKGDARLGFMMEEWDRSSDPIAEMLGQLVCLERSIRIIDLSGIPDDIAAIVSASVARLLFMYKLWETPSARARDPVLIVCEEAHRYVPNRGEARYASAQEAIRRIAKEGRKYGLGLMLVSQRPSDIESTVLSQCNSWVVLRLTNEEDRSQVVSCLPDSLAGMASILPSLRRREALFIGQAASMPARILLNYLKDDQLPRSQDISFADGWGSEPVTPEHMENVALRWRVQMRGEHDNPQ